MNPGCQISPDVFVMGQQQGKQGVAAGYPPSMDGIAAAPSSSKVPPPVSRIKGLKPKQPRSAMSPSLGAGSSPSGAVLGIFNELSNGKSVHSTYIHCLLISVQHSVQHRFTVINRECPVFQT